MNNVLYHSSYGGALVFELNDNCLEHGVPKTVEDYAKRNKSRDNSVKQRYANAGLFKAGEEAKERQTQKKIQEAKTTIASKVDRFCNKIKVNAEPHFKSKNMNSSDIAEALEIAASYEVVLNQKGEITIGDIVLVPRGVL